MNCIVYSLGCIIIIFAILIFTKKSDYESFTVLKRDEIAINENDKNINSMGFQADYPLSDSYTNVSADYNKISGGGTIGRFPPVPVALNQLEQNQYRVSELVGHTDLKAPIRVSGRSIRGPRVDGNL